LAASFILSGRFAGGSRLNALLIIAALAGGPFASRHQDLFSWQWRACSTNQFVRFKQNVVVVRLLSGKKADSHKKRTEDQADKDDLSVCAFVSVMK
jgi:hypothetical protein